MEKEEKFWHVETEEEVLAEVSSDRKKGLSEEEAKKRLLQGRNILSTASSFKWFRVFFDKCNSLLVFILAGAAFVAFIFNEALEFAIILVIVLMTILLGFFQEYKADRTIKALNKLTAKKVFVLRSGKQKEIDAEELVQGDIVFLKRGDIVPADIRLLQVEGLQVTESNITGESRERIKRTGQLTDKNLGLGDMDNMAFSSTHVIAGKAKGVVVETGLNTVIGRISSSLEQIHKDKSPIQKKIDKMSKRISYIVLTVAAVLLFVLVFQGNSIYSSLIIVSAVAIAGIPESFPLALTLTFSNGIKKMAKKNAIVKDLNSVETLGTTTVICTDKTGTLTENNMRVSRICMPGNISYDVKGTGYEPVNRFFTKGKEVRKVPVSDNFINALVLCNDADLVHQEKGWDVVGEPTEGALLALARSLSAETINENCKRVHVVPFNPLKKFMITVNRKKGSSYHDFYLKGAGEIVLEICSRYRTQQGTVKKLNKRMRQQIIRRMEAQTSEGFRVLAAASKSIKSKKTKKFIDNNLYSRYVFEGFVCIEDPIREEVYEAVKQCRASGIKTVMITGDHKLIAKNIGKKIGLYSSKTNNIIEGFELDRLNDEELDSVIQETTIFARTTPEHKLRIVDSFKRHGDIVAMTGDGVNDAPALKKADIGVAMGRKGTEVAREASNMILTDDNFATIVNAVKEGRTVYSNIRRFIYYLLTGNFTEVGLIFLAVIMGFSLPLTALMILFINLVTSTIPALSLSVEPTHEKVMRQKPRNPRERLLSGYILTKIVVMVPFLLLGTLGLFMWELIVTDGSLHKAMTIAFATLITFELFHSFNSRRLHTTIFDNGFFNNRSIFISVAFSFFLTLLAIYHPIGQSIFSTISLSLMDWVVVVSVSMTVIIFNEVIKYLIMSEFREQSTLQGRRFVLE